VASVASQNLDLMKWKLNPYHKSLSTYESLLTKEKPWSMYENTPTWNKFGLNSVFGQDDYVIPIEELMVHPLFQQYLRLPLFVKMWEEHPVVFKKYVESPLFQKFWTIPQFKLYFTNPILFYKYIVPQLQIISEIVVPTTTSFGVYDVPETMWTTPFSKYNYPYTYKYNSEWSVPMMMGQKTYNPYKTTTNYKWLLEKMMNHLNVNRGIGMTETLNNVLDEQIVPTETLNVPETTLTLHQIHTLKNMILKHIILHKIFGSKITPDVYSILMREHLPFVPEMYKTHFYSGSIIPSEVLERIYGTNKFHVPEFYNTLWDTKKVFTPTVYDIFFNDVTHKKWLTPELYDVLFKGSRNVNMTPDLFEPMFGKTIYTPSVYSSLFGDVMTTPEVDLDTMSMYPYRRTIMNHPYVNRMMWNRKFSPRMTYKTEKMLEEFEKEKMVEDVMKNELYNVDTHVPTIMDPTMIHRVPLTMGKTITTLEDMTKDIKF
jgi:hypothetical protein